MNVAYWALTLIVGFEMVQGSMWDLVGTEYATGVAAHLGYPHYLGVILGAAKLACAIALLAPRFERLKEWAYAGAVFNYAGAAASAMLVGDAAGQSIAPIVFAAMTLLSWALRPADRRLPAPAERTALSIRAWLVPLVIVVAFAAVSLPQYPPGRALLGLAAG